MLAFYGGGKETCKLFDGVSNQLLGCLDEPNTVTALCFSPDGTMLAAGCTDRGVPYIMLWNTDTKAKLGRLDGHTAYIVHLCFSNDGSRLLSNGCDNSVRVWNVGTGSQTNLIQYFDKGAMFSTFFNSDNTKIVGAFGNVDSFGSKSGGQIKVWNFSNDCQVCEETFSIKGLDHRTVLAVHPKLDVIASIYDKGIVGVYDLQRNGSQIAALDGKWTSSYICITGLTYSPSGDKLVVCAKSAGIAKNAGIHVWDTSSNSILFHIADISHRVFSPGFSPLEDKICLATSEGYVVIDASDGTIAHCHTKEPSGMPTYGVCYQPSSQVVLM